MQLQHLRAFRVVAQERSFTRAAQHLHCAQSTVTGHIKQLETAVGADLFHRHGRCQVRLTRAGELLLGHAETILNAVDTANYEIRQLAGERETPWQLRYLTGAIAAPRSS